MRIYIGTYTHGSASEGIYRCVFDPETGELVQAGVAARCVDPSFLALHPSGNTLYACNETVGDGDRVAGSVSAFAIEPDSSLTLLNQQSTGGALPCQLSIDHSGSMVMVANYGGGSVASFAILPDGALSSMATLHQFYGSGLDARRQQAPHAHSIWPDPTNHWALACDLGTDRVRVFSMVPARARLTPARMAFARVEAGSGPRHLTFHPNGRWVYLLNEIRSAVTVFDWHADLGVLAEVQHLRALPADFAGPNGAADIHLTPNGRFLFASNRGQDALAAFAVDASTGRLTPIGYQPTGGQHPRNFCIDPSGRWLLVANMHSDNIVVFHIDGRTGALEPIGAALTVPSPCCILFA